jgi:hypothetical protein
MHTPARDVGVAEGLIPRNVDKMDSYGAFWSAATVEGRETAFVGRRFLSCGAARDCKGEKSNTIVQKSAQF